MPNRLALKRLTQSDLTFIDWHFQRKTFGESRQKAINLNARVFVEQMFPELLRTPASRFDVLVTVFGPGGARAFTPDPQTRPVLNNNGKNWRLNGRTLPEDPAHPERFSDLTPGDLVLLECRGWPAPTEVDLTFVSATDDAVLHEALGSLVAEAGRNSMVELTRDIVDNLLARTNLPADHPLAPVSEAELLERDEAIEEIARGRAIGDRLSRRRGGPRLTPEELEQARSNAVRIGADGEVLVFAWLTQEQEQGRISALDWIARRDASAPYDFTFREGGVEVRMDAKATRGLHDRKFHLSFGELLEAASAAKGPYRIARVSMLNEDGAKLRIMADLQPLAENILNGLFALPEGVEPDAFSICPNILEFDSSIDIEWPEPNDI